MPSSRKRGLRAYICVRGIIPPMLHEGAIVGGSHILFYLNLNPVDLTPVEPTDSHRLEYTHNFICAHYILC